MDIIEVKLLVLVGLIAMTVTLGFLPILIISYIKKRSGPHTEIHKQLKYKRTISILSCYAAGVFLATCLLDLLPGVRESLKTVLDSLKAETDFPIAEFVMSFGLFLILVIEQIVLTFKEKQLMNSDNAKEPLLPNNSVTNFERQKSLTQSMSSEISEHSISGISDEPNIRRARSTSGYMSEDSDHDILYSTHDQDGHSHFHQEHTHSTLRSLLLLLALSLHSMFEGLAVGLQKETSQVLGIFAALVLHKSILSFSLGMNLVQSKLTRRGVIKSVIMFSLSAPVGVGIGIGIINLWDTESSNLVQGILQGIACGTFLYVTFFEVLPHEFNSSDIRLVKVICLVFGFSTVTGIVYLNVSRQ